MIFKYFCEKQVKSHEVFFCILIIAVSLMSGCVSSPSQDIYPQSVNSQVTSPHLVTLRIADGIGNPLIGAGVIAVFNSTTAQTEMLNPSKQTGTTDSSGNIVFSLSGNVKYDILITYQGIQQSYQIYPQGNYYQFFFRPPPPPDTSLQTCLYANGNTRTSSFYSSDFKQITFVWSYQDICGLTTKVDFYLIDSDLNKIVYQKTIENPGTSIATFDYTVLNERGKNYQWFENETRSV
jgi:hypothetical protein